MIGSDLPRASSLLRKLVLLFGGLLVGLLVVEGAARLRQYFKYGTVRAQVSVWATDPVTGLTIPAPGGFAGGIRIDSRGFRNPELSSPKPEGTIRLAFLGASTTFCAECGPNEQTWPHLVCEAIARRFPGARFDYINAGVPGYTTEHSLVNFEGRVKPLEPDVVVIYHGTNDLSLDTRRLAQEQGVHEIQAEDHSWLARISVAWFLIEKNLTIKARQRNAADAASRLRFDPVGLSGGFRTRLDRLVSRVGEACPVVALATFSTHVRRDQPREKQLEACNTSLYYMPYMSIEGLLDGFDEYNRVIREVATRRKALLIGDEHAIPADATGFADSVHFSVAGSRIMAERVANALAESTALRELVRTRAARAGGS
jgi:lysophospholipase L1-like esterase